MQSSAHQLEHVKGLPVVTSDGFEVGIIDDVFIDKSGEAKWAKVETDLGIEHVPLVQASIEDDAVVLNYDSEKVMNAPQVDNDNEDYAKRTIDYYNTAPESLEDNPEQNEGEDVEDAVVDRVSDSVHEDVAVALHKEEVGVEKRTVDAGRVRLKKFIVENTVQVPVTLREERARLVVDPLDEKEDQGSIDAQMSEDIQEVVLKREVAVINKQVIAMGRARVETFEEERDVQIPAIVREERAELEEIQ